MVAAQIETASALAEVDEIAAVDGVDILFVGPTDLAHSLELHCPPDDPRLLERVRPVAEAAASTARPPACLTGTTRAAARRTASSGFTFLGGSSDGGLLALAATRPAASRDAGAVTAR